MNNGPAYVPRINIEVYRILDDAMRKDLPSPGWRGGIHAVIDELRSARGPQEVIAMAEAIAIQLHRLEWARRDGDIAAADMAKRSLKGVAADWLNFRVFH